MILLAGSLGLRAAVLPSTIWDLCWEEYEKIYPELDKREVEKTRQFVFAGVRVMSADNEEN